MLRSASRSSASAPLRKNVSLSKASDFTAHPSALDVTVVAWTTRTLLTDWRLCYSAFEAP
jgi:hypothetical protein